MRFRVAILTSIAMAVVSVCLAQDASNDKIPIDELRVPSSPAFTILGVSPTAVERPSTPRALALSLLSATERQGSGVPKDIALEVAPFWWRSHPDLTFASYYDSRKGLGKTIAQTLAVSLGTTDLEDQAGIPGTRVAIGLRFALRQGRQDPLLKERVRELQAVQTRLLECVPDEPSEPIDEGCASEVEKEVRKARELVAEKAERIGWTIEAAAASTRDMPDNDTEQGANTRYGGWLTASYHHGGPLSVVVVARYLSDDDATAAGRSEDLGGRLIMKGEGDAQIPPLAVSIEYLRRFAERGDDSSRLVAVLEYRLPLENLSLVASYGKDFKDVSGHDSLVSTLGVSIGLGKSPVANAQ